MPSGSLKRNERHTGHIAVLGTRLDDPELWPRFAGTAFGRRSSALSHVAAEPLVGLRGHPGGDNLLKRQIIHEAHEDLLVLIHTLHKEILDQVLEHQFEPITGIDCCRLPQVVVDHGGLDNLIEEELVGLVEVGAEALIHEIDQLRQRHGCGWTRPLPTSVGPSRGRASPSSRLIDPSLIFCRR
jgi:hypothetical protein